MFFSSSELPSLLQFENKTLAENANRSLFCYAQTRIRSGHGSEALSLALQLKDRSLKQNDSIHYFASMRLIQMATQNSSPCNSPDFDANTPEFDGNTQNRDGNINEAFECRLQARFTDAISSYYAMDYAGAISQLEGICNSIGAWKKIHLYTASVYCWLASSIRNEWLRTPRSKPSTAFQLKRKWRKAVSIAVNVADRFEQEKPQAYRELGWYNAFHEGAHQASSVTRALRASLLVSQRLGLTKEESQTLADWNTLTEHTELNVPEMEANERARWCKLCPAIPSTCNHCLHGDGCTCASETDIAMEVEELRRAMFYSVEDQERIIN